MIGEDKRLGSAPSLEDVRRIGERLSERSVTGAAPAGSGRNNRIYRLDCGGDSFALKFYPPQDEDPRDRLGAEFRALDYLGRQKIAAVPGAIARDTARHCALYEWIEGAPLADPTDSDVDSLAAFLTELQDLRWRPGADEIGPASASCLSPAAAVLQFDSRLRRLMEAAGEHRELSAFIADELSPVAVSVKGRGLVELAQAGLDPAAEVPRSAQALSPSDFGFHNALRRADGRLVFLDFEYFGWDDPAKMVADVLLHPGSDLSDSRRRRLYNQLGPAFAISDPSFNLRFRILLPVCALIWCLILLNEFLPERWQRRAIAGAAADRETVQARQLEKARQLLAWIHRSLAQPDT